MNFLYKLTFSALFILFCTALTAQQRYLDPSGSNVGNDCSNSGTPCQTIGHAVSEANAGDTLVLANGTYVDAAQVVIDKDIAIRSASGNKSDVTLTKDFDTGAGGDARGWYLVNPGIQFDLADLTMEGAGFLTFQAIRSRGSNNINNVCFQNIDYNSSGPTYSGVVLAIFGTNSVGNVRNSVFRDIGRIGVLYFGSTTSGVFDGNIYTGKGDGDHLDYATDISAGANIQVSNNVVSGNTGVASSDGSVSAGFLVSTFFGAGTNANFQCNEIINNSFGIVVGFDAADVSTVVANSNNIDGNAGAGVRSSSVNNMIDAENNYWGSPDGPSGDGPGSGDAVSGSTIDFDPFLSSPSACAPNAPTPIPTMSQWALFLFGLSVFTLGIVVVWNINRRKMPAKQV